jgi:excisionase family DNA binding protein
MSRQRDGRRPQLNSTEVAKLFGIARRTLYRWLEEQKIPEPMVDPDTGQRIWRQIDLDGIQQYLAERGRADKQ